MNETIVAVVDRIEGRVVVLEADDGTRFELEKETFPFHVGEGTVLRAPRGEGGVPDWRSARRDRDEEERRMRELRERMERLSAGDPGGDVKL